MQKNFGVTVLENILQNLGIKDTNLSSSNSYIIKPTLGLKILGGTKTRQDHT